MNPVRDLEMARDALDRILAGGSLAACEQSALRHVSSVLQFLIDRRAFQASAIDYRTRQLPTGDRDDAD